VWAVTLVGGVGDDATMDDHRAHTGGSKQHAIRRDRPPPVRPLWVYDADDWAVMKSLEKGILICPVPGCRSAFQRPVQNAQGTRFLRDMPGQSCSHTLARPDLGGGAVSSQHRWLQARLARICERLGYAVIPEHHYADVYVENPVAGRMNLAIEVQRWSTEFEKRTEARVAGYAQVLWLLTEDATEKQVTRALFRLPAARLRVHHRRDAEARLQPWDDPALNREAWLSVYATAAKWNHTTGELSTGLVDAATFLAELLDGRRRWHPPGTPGLPRRGGAWILDEDRQRTPAWSRPAPLVSPPGRTRPAPAPTGHLRPPAPNPPPSVRSLAPARPPVPPVAATPDPSISEPPDSRRGGEARHPTRRDASEPDGANADEGAVDPRRLTGIRLPSTSTPAPARTQAVHPGPRPGARLWARLRRLLG